MLYLLIIHAIFFRVKVKIAAPCVRAGTVKFNTSVTLTQSKFFTRYDNVG